MVASQIYHIERPPAPAGRLSAIMLSIALVLNIVFIALLWPINALAQQNLTQDIVITEFLFTGNTLIDDDTLTVLVSDAVGQRLTFDQLEQVVDRVTESYRSRGYIGSFAYLPEQRIEDGRVEIGVLEARYGTIELRNASRLSDTVSERIIADIQPGDMIDGNVLENRVRALSSLPGVRARSALTPGQEGGTADLIVTVTDGPRLSGRVEVSNAGTRLTGALRAGINLNVNNLSGLGDRLFASLKTGGSGYFQGSVGYQMPLGARPNKLSFSYSQTEYLLGQEYAGLGAQGNTKSINLGFTGPSVTEMGPLEWSVNLSHRQMQDHLLGGVKDKQIQSVEGTIKGEHQGVLTGVGSRVRGQYSLGVTAGRLDLLTPSELAVDEVTVKTNGMFQKIHASYNVATAITQSVSLVGSVQGQLAFKNLDLTEKMSLGGPAGVRAYPTNEASGDDALLVTAEIRHTLLADQSQSVQAVVFADMGHVRLNKNPYDLAAPNGRSLYGAGLGLLWSVGDVSVSAHYAGRIGPELATSDVDRGGRFWVHADYRF